MRNYFLHAHATWNNNTHSKYNIITNNKKTHISKYKNMEITIYFFLTKTSNNNFGFHIAEIAAAVAVAAA